MGVGELPSPLPIASYLTVVTFTKHLLKVALLKGQRSYESHIAYSLAADCTAK